jgi:hypothetical protein
MVKRLELLALGCVFGHRRQATGEGAHGGEKTMGLYDSFYAGLTCPNCGCQASVEAQTKDFENAMLTFSLGERVELLAQADFRGQAGCRWCEALVEVPILVREGRFIGFGEPALMSPQPIPLPPPAVKNPMKAGKIAAVVRVVQARYRGEVYLGWDRGCSSIAVWHEGRWLCASIWGTPEDTLNSLAEAAGGGVIQRRVQRIEEVLIQRAGGDPHKRLRAWGLREIDRAYLHEVETKLQGVLQSIGVAFADVTVTAQGKLHLTAAGTSAESVFHEDIGDTVVGLLRDWVRAKAGIGERFRLFRDDKRAIEKTLEQLERALGIMGGDT